MEVQLIHSTLDFAQDISECLTVVSTRLQWADLNVNLLNTAKQVINLLVQKCLTSKITFKTALYLYLTEKLKIIINAFFMLISGFEDQYYVEIRSCSKAGFKVPNKAKTS